MLFFLIASASMIAPAPLVKTQAPPVVFEIELPDFDIPPSSSPELTIPSSNVNRVFVHILRPVADGIDYSAIRTSVNGEASATIAETLSGSRGKLVKIELKRLPGFEFVTGKNTVEVWAQNRRGRVYYASFVLRTATGNRNENFTYQVEQSVENKGTVPPELLLLEPERAIEFFGSRKSLVVRISGVATAATSIKRVSLDGRTLPLKMGAQVTLRTLGLANEDKRVAFETSVTVASNSPPLIVEAEDQTGSRTRLSIPVLARSVEHLASFTGRKYALVVGISKYRNNVQGIPDLKYADIDARSMYQFLQRPSGGGFSVNDMLLLTNEDATIARLRQALTSFVNKASPDDLLLIFIAGHGDADPTEPRNLYILAHDTSITNMPETALAMPDLRQYVERNVRAKRVVLLVDTCHSAGLSTEITRALANNLTNLYLEKLLYSEEGRAIITSSDVNEVSRESPKWGQGHGVFTYYVLEGLKGKADSNEDRLVSVGELFRFVRQQVRLDTEFKQNPRMLVGANENVALAARVQN